MLGSESRASRKPVGCAISRNVLTESDAGASVKAVACGAHQIYLRHRTPHDASNPDEEWAKNVEWNTIQQFAELASARPLPSFVTKKRQRVEFTRLGPWRWSRHRQRASSTLLYRIDTHDGGDCSSEPVRSFRERGTESPDVLIGALHAGIGSTEAMESPTPDQLRRSIV